MRTCGSLLVLAAVAVLMVGGCEQPAQSDGTAVQELRAPHVKLETSMGDIVIELYEEMAPVTVANFLRYVEEGFYDGTVFHRVIDDYIVQAGGLTADLARKMTHRPIANEAANGLKNVRGAVAMARLQNPASATSQFFINVADNPALNYIPGENPGYAVFGKVVEGMDVVDAMSKVPTREAGVHLNVPVEPIVIESATVLPPAVVEQN